jgi:hypothetical protein
MEASTMSGRHSEVVRGLMATKRSRLFQGTFGRMFRLIPAATYGRDDAESEANLLKLGAAMSADFDPPKDGRDEEESGIPTLYTYLGQFVDHDLTFDPSSISQKQNDVDALTDFRSPAFDLDSVYGRGPNDQPYLYDADGKSFVLGTPLRGGHPAARDLQRAGPQASRALIGDPRNDENSLVSQLHGLFLRFHNRVVSEHPTWSFEDVQQFVRFHYQFVVLHDFLPRIVIPSVLADLKSHGHFDRHKLEFFHPRNQSFMPVEFAGACYRLGHSMIRPGYRLNDGVLLPIFPVPPDFPDGLTGFRAMPADRALDWGRFIDIDVRSFDGDDAVKRRRLQFAYRLDTSLVNPLANLPLSVAGDPPHSLAGRNLVRGLRLGLPSGQRVARAMRVPPLKDKEILIGKATGTAGDAVPITDKSLGLPDVFAGNCPLWTYILAEAMHHAEPVHLPVKESVKLDTPRLGPVGGRVVAEVFVGLLFGDPGSFLNVDPLWHPEAGPEYALKDFVNFALGQGPRAQASVDAAAKAPAPDAGRSAPRPAAQPAARARPRGKR